MNAAGEKGVSVVADPVRGRFVLLFRALEPDATLESAVVSRAGGGRGSILLETHLAIHYCPACGEDLSALIKHHRLEFESLPQPGVG